jgi:hypothetical protein
VYLEGMPETDGFRAGVLLLAAQFPGQSHGEVLEGGRDKLGRRFRLAGGPGLALPGVPGKGALKVLRRRGHPRWHGR